MDEGWGGESPEHDPEYDYIPPLPKSPPPRKGVQCGKCGMKFEYGKAYSYCCQNYDCPAGWGPNS